MIVFWIVFKIGVLNNNIVSHSVFEADSQRGALPSISRLENDTNIVGRPTQRFQYFTCSVRGSVIDDNDLLRDLDGLDAAKGLRHGRSLIENRDDDGYFHYGCRAMSLTRFKLVSASERTTSGRRRGVGESTWWDR